MSSVARSFGVKKEGLTRFVKPESPCYDTNDDEFISTNRLFPFTYNNGVLDITYDGNNFKSLMVDISGNAPLDEAQTSVRIMGGPYLVSSLGSKFKAYVRSWREGTIDSGSPIEIYLAPQILKVQEADLENVNADSGESYKISTQAPSGDNYINGNATNTYCTTYVFKTPLTFTIKESGVTKYITFRTILDQE